MALSLFSPNLHILDWNLYILENIVDLGKKIFAHKWKQKSIYGKKLPSYVWCKLPSDDFVRNSVWKHGRTTKLVCLFWYFWPKQKRKYVPELLKLSLLIHLNRIHNQLLTKKKKKKKWCNLDDRKWK